MEFALNVGFAPIVRIKLTLSGDQRQRTASMVEAHEQIRQREKTRRLHPLTSTCIRKHQRPVTRSATLSCDNPRYDMFPAALCQWFTTASNTVLCALNLTTRSKLLQWSRGDERTDISTQKSNIYRKCTYSKLRWNHLHPDIIVPAYGKSFMDLSGRPARSVGLSKFTYTWKIWRVKISWTKGCFQLLRYSMVILAYSRHYRVRRSPSRRIPRRMWALLGPPRFCHGTCEVFEVRWLEISGTEESHKANQNGLKIPRSRLDILKIGARDW